MESPYFLLVEVFHAGEAFLLDLGAFSASTPIADVKNSIREIFGLSRDTPVHVGYDRGIEETLLVRLSEQFTVLEAFQKYSSDLAVVQVRSSRKTSMALIGFVHDDCLGAVHAA